MPEPDWDAMFEAHRRSAILGGPMLPGEAEAIEAIRRWVFDLPAPVLPCDRFLYLVPPESNTVNLVPPLPL